MRAAAVQAAQEQVTRARKGITESDDALLKQIETNGVAILRAAFALVELPGGIWGLLAS